MDLNLGKINQGQGWNDSIDPEASPNKCFFSKERKALQKLSRLSDIEMHGAPTLLLLSHGIIRVILSLRGSRKL